MGKAGPTIAVLRCLGEASKIDRVLVLGMDIQEFDAGAEILHELPQSSRGDAPVIGCLFLVELGMDRRTELEGQSVLGCHTCTV